RSQATRASRTPDRITRRGSGRSGLPSRCYRSMVCLRGVGSGGWALPLSAMSGDEHKPRSKDVTEGMERAPARAMLRAVGMGEGDWGRSQVGIASSWNEVTPCNLPLARLARAAKEGVRAAGGFPLEFTTIAVSDGISMGTEGMRASLSSREIIADSVECVMHGERFDGMVTLAG